MPNRIIRDGILRSERVDLLSIGAELFYRRLMSVVDDFGRYEARAKLLKVDCFPLRDSVTVEDVEGWLAECVGAHGLVRVYEVGGKRFLQLDNFNQRSRSASKYPAPSSQPRDGEQQANAAVLPSSASECQTDDGHLTDKSGHMADQCPPLRTRADVVVFESVVGDVVVVGGGARADAAAPNERPPLPPDDEFECLLVDLLAMHPAVGSLPLSRLEIDRQFQRHGGGDRSGFEKRIRESHANQLPAWTRRTRPVRCPELQYWLADGGWRVNAVGPVLAPQSVQAATCAVCDGLNFLLREDGAGIHCPKCGGMGKNTVAFEAGEMADLAAKLRAAPIVSRQAVAL